MKYKIHSKKMKVTTPIEEYIKEKLGKLDQYFKDLEDTEATVNLKIGKVKQEIEVTITSKIGNYRAEEQAEDIYAAIDLVSEKLERQLRKKKTSFQSQIKKTFKPIIFRKNIPKEKEIKITKRLDFEMKPMNEEEAILEMNAGKHNFYMFKNCETNQMNVVYIRKNGTYGVIKAS